MDPGQGAVRAQSNAPSLSADSAALGFLPSDRPSRFCRGFGASFAAVTHSAKIQRASDIPRSCPNSSDFVKATRRIDSLENRLAKQAWTIRAKTLRHSWIISCMVC